MRALFHRDGKLRFQHALRILWVASPRLCSGTEFEVASLTLAANAVLVIFESSFSLVEFMEFFLDLALASTEDCEEVTYAALAAIERFEDPLGRYK